MHTHSHTHKHFSVEEEQSYQDDPYLLKALFEHLKSPLMAWQEVTGQQDELARVMWLVKMGRRMDWLIKRGHRPLLSKAGILCRINVKHWRASVFDLMLFSERWPAVFHHFWLLIVSSMIYEKVIHLSQLKFSRWTARNKQRAATWLTIVSSISRFHGFYSASARRSALLFRAWEIV